MTNETLKKLKLPDKPGVYFFLKNKKILYIGKATSLRDRTKSYFSKDLINTRGPLVLDMVFKSDNIKWEATDSVLEALILEANLIKKYQPYYNTREKDDKSFNYVCITREKLPRVLVVRGRVLKNYKGSIFGPYTSGTQLHEALKILRRIFPFIDDKSSKKQNYEFYKQLGLTPDASSPSEIYLDNIKYLKLFFKGKKKDIIRDLKKKMMQKAKEGEFEKAGEVKRQIFALKHINDIALIKNSFADNKIFGPAPSFGRISGSKAGPSDTKILLSALLFRIEAYDIAHMGGKNMVGVMTVLENDEAVKSEYRKFKIKTQNNVNDTGALAEVLERRLMHKEWAFPDLIVVDGGMAQINAAKSVLKKMGLNIPVVSVVKDEHHKPKAIMGDNPRHGRARDFGLKYKREILLANSEAHRFAISYHKNMRNKNFLI
ncbi:MAG: GIY-YIG nuclease family protein [Candidatus Pacebacteria bacterium]|nr:GIY-YIG nuclease family protein [Candidatus Paceibacterota bacterium]